MRQLVKVSILRLARHLPDKPYVYLLYWMRTGQLLRLKHPQSFSQKIQWLKLHGNLERFARYADKYMVREYVEAAVGKEYLIPLIGVWDSFNDIPFESLPNRFVLKVTNGCEYNFICKDKRAMNYEAVKAQFDAWQRQRFYLLEREAQYKPTKPRIVCEQYLEDDSGSLRDYKFHCANGEPKYVQVDVDRFIGHRSEMRDLTWRKVDIRPARNFADIYASISKPDNLREMIKLAKRLAAPFPYVRVDLYTVGNKIYFGELTFTPGSGTVLLKPRAGELEFGRLIDLNAYTSPLAA